MFRVAVLVTANSGVTEFCCLPFAFEYLLISLQQTRNDFAIRKKVERQGGRNERPSGNVEGMETGPERARLLCTRRARAWGSARALAGAQLATGTKPAWASARAGVSGLLPSLATLEEELSQATY